MTGQEIKELIADEIITLQELDVPALEKVLDFEIEMICHGNGDMDVMRQCSEILDERSKSDKLNHDDILAVINKTKSEHVTVFDADNTSVVAHRRKNSFVLKRIAIIAAAIVITVASTFTIAAAFDIDILKYLKSITGQPDGTTVDIDGFTFQNIDGTQKYESIQQMVEEENLNIMYPTRFPEGFDIKSIRLIDDGNGNLSVEFCTADTYVGITVDLDIGEDPQIFGEIYEHDGKTYYINCKGSNNLFYAACVYRQNTYYISAHSYKDLIFIIDNMKDNTKE